MAHLPSLDRIYHTVCKLVTYMTVAQLPCFNWIDFAVCEFAITGVGAVLLCMLDLVTELGCFVGIDFSVGEFCVGRVLSAKE